MLRMWTVCALSYLSLISTSFGQDTSSELNIYLDVEARVPPKPALKYQLLPEITEMTPGNAYPAYLKCFAEQNNYFYGKESVERQTKWLKMSLKELPEEVRQYTVRGPMARMDKAARMESIDWQIVQEMKQDGVHTLLPDVQILRNLASWNQIRIRFQVKEKRFDEAIHSTQSMFALARHFSQHPCLIGHLVGVAIANLSIQPLEEMLQQSGAPNLFWAYSFLPKPLMSLEKGLQGEMLFIHVDFGSLLAKDRVWSQEDIEKAIQKSSDLATVGELSKDQIKKIESWSRSRFTDEAWLKGTRKVLIELGYPENKVNKYPPEQVILFYLVEHFYSSRDDRLKWAMLPLWECEEFLMKFEKPLPDDASVEEIIGHRFIAAVPPVLRASARLEQRLGMLRHVEALRLYAAENGGKLPKELSEIKLPLPNDPMTGKPFVYKLDGETAIIQGTPAKGMAHLPQMKVIYHVTIKK
jgi:hypothetical protein